MVTHHSHHGAAPTVGIQFKMHGSILESTGGKILASAEALGRVFVSEAGVYSLSASPPVYASSTQRCTLENIPAAFSYMPFGTRYFLSAT